MKIEQVRKIKSIESEFLKLSKNDNVHLSKVVCNHKRGFFNDGTDSLLVELYLSDDDLGEVKISIETLSPSHVENLKTILEMLQGSV
ncbi:MAG: hypothetical protein RR623_00540 [Bacilli bacterium]